MVWRAFLPVLLAACGQVAPLAAPPSDAGLADADAGVSFSCPGVPSISPKPVCDLRWSNGDGHQRILGMAAAADGSVLVHGMTDGATTLGGFVLEGSPPSFSYYALIDSQCAVKWARAFDGVEGGVVATGSDRFVIASREGISTLHVFAVDVDGHDSWTRTATSSVQFLDLVSLTADASGNVFLTGASEGTVDFGTGPLPLKTGNPPTEQYLAKLDPNGNVVYARSFSYAMTTAFACDGSSLWLNGFFMNGSVDFDGQVIAYGGDADGIVDFGYLARLSAQDGSFVDGVFDPTARALGANACTGVVYSGGPTLAAYGAPGAAKWTKTLDAPTWAIAVDGDGNAWEGGSTDVSLASFGADASARFANHWGSDTDFNSVDAIAITKTGAIVMTGSVHSPVLDFGLGPLSGAMDAASPVFADAYFVRLE